MANELRIGDDVFTVNPLLGERSFLLQPLIAPVLPDCGALFGLFVRAFAVNPREAADAVSKYAPSEVKEEPAFGIAEAFEPDRRPPAVISKA